MVGRGAEDLDETLKRLEALREVSLELTSERDLQKLLDLIVERTGNILGAERGTLYLIDYESHSLGEGVPVLVSRVAQQVDEIRLPLNEKSIAGAVGTSGKVINLEDAYQDPRFNPSFDRRDGFKTCSMLTAPMHNPQGEIIGVTQAINKKGSDRFSADDERLLLAFSSQAAIAVENARYLELQKRTFESLIHGQAVAIDTRDHITAGHTWRVTAYAVEIGLALGWSGQQLEILRYASLLHDQGKLGVPDDILLKPARLSRWEFRMIQSHASKTRTILEAVRPLFPKRLRTVPEIAASHHEKLDGTGYPEGLRGEGLSMSSRVVAVADIFDALTSHRPYRVADPDEKVIELLKRDVRDGKLDGEVVAALEAALPKIQKARLGINQRVKQDPLSVLSRMTGSSRQA